MNMVYPSTIICFILLNSEWRGKRYDVLSLLFFFQLALSSCCQHPASSEVWALSWYHPAFALSGFCCRQCDAKARAYGTHEYARQWLGKKTQICGNLSGEHNDAREDNLADGRVHSPIPQWLHEPSPPRSGTGECAAPRPAAAAVHGTVQNERGNGSWLAKATRRASPPTATGQRLPVFFPARSRKLAGWLAVARNLPRLVIHVAGLWSIFWAVWSRILCSP